MFCSPSRTSEWCSRDCIGSPHFPHNQEPNQPNMIRYSCNVACLAGYCSYSSCYFFVITKPTCDWARQHVTIKLSVTTVVLFQPSLICLISWHGHVPDPPHTSSCHGLSKTWWFYLKFVAIIKRCWLPPQHKVCSPGAVDSGGGSPMSPVDFKNYNVTCHCRLFSPISHV